MVDADEIYAFLKKGDIAVECRGFDHTRDPAAYHMHMEYVEQDRVEHVTLSTLEAMLDDVAAENHAQPVPRNLHAIQEHLEERKEWMRGNSNRHEISPEWKPLYHQVTRVVDSLEEARTQHVSARDNPVAQEEVASYIEEEYSADEEQ